MLASREVLANGGLGISRKMCSWGLGFWRGVRVWSLEKCVVWVSREVCGVGLSRSVWCVSLERCEKAGCRPLEKCGSLGRCEGVGCGFSRGGRNWSVLAFRDI